MKLWSGRFEGDTDKLTDKLNASIGFDSRLYREDITGSIAHAGMLGEQGIIGKDEADRIIAGLREILNKLESGELAFGTENEDIHMSVEAELTAMIGSLGGKLHTARSRNDQVALDFRMYLKRELHEISLLIQDLLAVLIRMSEATLETVMPGYTHLQRAQPTTFAHYMMAYANMFKRDITRIRDCLARMDEMPLGSGALASTTYPIDRYRVAAELGFAQITQNSIDSVSDRDFALEAMSALSILMMHLSRFSEEIILWSSWEFKFIELDDAFSTGSSIMPQKKNPDIAELVRGKTGRVYGGLMALLTVMKGLPLAYNKDMQEDKEPVFDAVDTVKLCLPVFTAMLDTMQLLPDNMRKAAGGGFINATDCADYLATKGMPFREAYTVIGKLVSDCIVLGKTLEELTIEEFQDASPLFDNDVYDSISLDTCIRRRNIPGGPAKERVIEQIQYIKDFIEG